VAGASATWLNAILFYNCVISLLLTFSFNLVQIKPEVLEKVRKGNCLTQKLSKEQLSGVIMFVGDQQNGNMMVLSGGAGCGKTLTLDEVLLLINQYHGKECPGDAL
jgi:Tfp pilus assembly pilus retraction ATPase PilT